MSSATSIDQISKARTIIALFDYDGSTEDLSKYYDSLMKVLPDVETIDYNNNALDVVTNCDCEPDKIIALLQTTYSAIRSGILHYVESERKAQEEKINDLL